MSTAEAPPPEQPGEVEASPPVAAMGTKGLRPSLMKEKTKLAPPPPGAASVVL